MKIAVCIKQVVTREWQLRVNESGTWIRDNDASFDVYRASGDRGGCGMDDSCGGGVSMVHLRVDASDDQTPAEQLGYRFVIVGGQPPPHIGFPSDDRVSGWGEFNWRFDGEYRGAFSFDVEIRAVDLNGNVGPATVVTISDPGR